MLRAEIRRRRRLLVVALVFALLSLAATVRASPVFIASPTPAADEATTCATVISRLPTTLDRRSMRVVTPTSGLTAAWGRPSITLACGVTAVADPLSNGEICFGQADGGCGAGSVQWFRDPFDDHLWKTRVTPHLAVVIPASDGLADVLPPISAAVLAK